MSAEELYEEAPVTVIRKLSPNEELEALVVSTPSALKFRKLGLKLGLDVYIQGSLFHLGETHYLSKSKNHNVGDVKKPAHDGRMFSMTITNWEDFAAQARWYEQFSSKTGESTGFKFDSAHLGGPRTRWPKGTVGYFPQSTKATAEITAAFANTADNTSTGASE